MENTMTRIPGWVNSQAPVELLQKALVLTEVPEPGQKEKYQVRQSPGWVDLGTTGLSSQREMFVAATLMQKSCHKPRQVFVRGIARELTM